eukprot:6213835-Amphidinium_carterae.1
MAGELPLTLFYLRSHSTPVATSTTPKGTIVGCPVQHPSFNVDIRLSKEHYTVADSACIDCCGRDVGRCYWFRSRSLSSWRNFDSLPSLLRASGIHPRSTLSLAPSAFCRKFFVNDDYLNTFELLFNVFVAVNVFTLDFWSAILGW